MNKLIAAASAAATAVLSAVTVCAAGFRTESDTIYPIKAAFDTKYTSVEWSYIPAEGAAVGTPLSSGGTVFLAVNDELLSFSEADGSKISSVILPEKCSSASGAVVGNTIIQPTENGLCTINPKTMEMISQVDFGTRVTGSCAADNGLAYITAEADSGERVICVDLANNLTNVWEYSAGNITELSRLNDRVIFGADSKLVSADMKSGSAYELELGKELTSAPYTTEYAIYFSCADGSVGRARLNEDGSFEDGTLTFCALEADSPTSLTSLTSPLAWNGSLYVCAENGMYVLDSLNMKQERVYSEIRGGISPWLCTGNGPMLYTVSEYEERYVLYCINLNEELEEPLLSKLAALDDFTGGAVYPAQSGYMFFRDGIGRLYALKAVGYDWFTIIIKLVLMIALFVGAFLWLRAWRRSKNPPKPKF